MTEIIALVPSVFSLAGTCVSACLEQPILAFFFAVGVTGTGLSVFKRMKGTL